LAALDATLEPLPRPASLISVPWSCAKQLPTDWSQGLLLLAKQLHAGVAAGVVESRSSQKGGLPVTICLLLAPWSGREATTNKNKHVQNAPMGKLMLVRVQPLAQHYVWGIAHSPVVALPLVCCEFIVRFTLWRRYCGMARSNPKQR